MFFYSSKNYSFIYTPLLENLKAWILKSIITWSDMGQQTAQSKRVHYQVGESKIVLILWQWACLSCRSVCNYIIKKTSQGMAINQRWHFLQKLSSWIDTRAITKSPHCLRCIMQVLNNVKSDIFVFVYPSKQTVWSFSLQCNLFKLLSFWGLIISSV